MARPASYSDGHLDHMKDHGKGVPARALRAGVRVEQEHTSDPASARQIAIDHLRERPDYYELLEKHVEGKHASRLRAAMTFAEDTYRGLPRLRMLHGGETVGEIVHKAPGVIQGAEIADKYRGLGLGRKLYGEATRRAPLVDGRPTLHSDGSVSAEAQRLWQSMAARPAPGQVVAPHPLSRPTTRPLEAGGRTPARAWDLSRVEGGVPDSGLYSTSLPAAAAKTSAAYKLQDRIQFRGLEISIENAKGSTRKWHDPHGKETGSTYMHHAYGYIRGTEGTDGDHVDVYVGPDESAADVFIVNQMKKPDFKEFDEQKVMLGFKDASTAKAAYLKQYNDPRFYGSMKAMPFEEFSMKVQDKVNHGKKIARADARRAALVAEQRMFGRGPTLLGGYPTKSAASTEDRLRALESAQQGGVHEKKVDGLAEHIDDAGLALLAGPAAAKLTGEGLHALARHIPTTSRFGRAAHMVADGAHGVGEWLERPGAGRNLEHLSEIAGLAMVSPTITKSIARRLAPEPVISPAPPTDMPESPEAKIARVQPSFVDSALRMARAIVPGSQKTVAAAAHAVPSPAVSKVVAKIPHTYAAPSPQNFHPAAVPGAPSPAKLQELPRGGNANWAPAQVAPAPAAALPPSARLATPPPGAATAPATAASAPAAAPAAAAPPAPVAAPATATPPVAAGAAAPAAGAGAPAAAPAAAPRGRILTPGRVLGAGAVGVGGLGLYGGYRAIDSMANIVDPQYAHQQGVSQEPVYPGRLY